MTSACHLRQRQWKPRSERRSQRVDTAGETRLFLLQVCNKGVHGLCTRVYSSHIGGNRPSPATHAMTAVPTVHLNGTGGQDLRREYQAAYRATKNAIEMLCNATCNGRDYYPQEVGAYSQAYAERQAALKKLYEVEDYLQDILMGILGQL
jgi:hypothetical protein